MVAQAPLADLTRSLESLNELAAQQARIALMKASPSAGRGKRSLRHAEKHARKTAAALFTGGNIEEANALLRLAAEICR